MPIIHHHISELRTALQSHRCGSNKQRIALVPTMGNLHQGHLELVKLAKEHADIVVVSIFVNPTQFGIGEDFDSYPRTLDADVAKLNTVDTDYVFAPSIDEMYPVLPPPTHISAGAITAQLCGQSRPTHFDGVGIVVSKLFNIVQPDIAVFGQKDYQQLTIIKQLVRDLSYPLEIIAAPIVRDIDGLALSSRNQYLTPDERKIAPILHQELQHLAQQLIDATPTPARFDLLLTQTCERLTDAGFVMDYLALKTPQLEPLWQDEVEGLDIHDSAEDIMILVAAWLGRARLLDNQPLTLSHNRTL